MGIKIVKKRNAGAVPPPAEVVPRSQPAQPISEAERQGVTLCTYCKHPYIKPCHGESDACMNKRFVDERLKN